MYKETIFVCVSFDGFLPHCIECFKLLADSTDMQLLVRVLANPQLLRVRQASL